MSGQLPPGFDASRLPAGFDISKLPSSINLANLPTTVNGLDVSKYSIPDLLQVLNLCNFSICDPADSGFNYQPSLAANLIFAIIFGLCILSTPIFIWRYRTYSYSILVALGCIGELLGYAGRIWGHYNPWHENAFLIQICALTISPTFLAASIYITLSKLVGLIGDDISRIKKSWYTWFFCAVDLVSLILQGAGGGISATAAKGDMDMLQTGNWTMIAGLIFQVVTLAIFIVISLEYFWRAKRLNRLARPLQGKQGSKLKIFLGTLALSTVLILVRCIFRVVELWDGWDGALMKNEKKFIALEGGMVAASAVLLTLFNPTWAMGSENTADSSEGKELEGYRSSSLSSV